MCASLLRIHLATPILFVFFGATSLLAQTPGERLRSEFPELSALFNASHVAHGAMFERLVEIGQSSESEAARNELREALVMLADMDMGHMMMGGMGTDEPDIGPFGDLESAAVRDLTQLIREQHSAADGLGAYAESDPLPSEAAAVLRRGAEFEARLFDIYLDAGISDRSDAVTEAVVEYLSDASLAVPSTAKLPALTTGHPFASAFRTGYPELSGFMFAQQWLKLASLEPIMQGGDPAAVDAGVNTTLERFDGKIAGMGGMSMFPTELPMVPAVSPLLYIRHPRAGTILDNLSMLKIIIADLLVHPDVQDRDGSIEAIVSEFTNPDTNLVEMEQDYLLFALRGGIFNQGGPALGVTLQGSERNRSRAAMEMGAHDMPLAGMN